MPTATWRQRATDFQPNCLMVLRRLTLPNTIKDDGEQTVDYYYDVDLPGYIYAIIPSDAIHTCNICMTPVIPDATTISVCVDITSLQAYNVSTGGQNGIQQTALSGFILYDNVHQFDVVNVPRNATITTATLDFNWDTGFSSISCNSATFDVRIEDTDDAPDPTSVTNYSTYTWNGTTTGSQNFDLTAGTGATYTVNVTELVQAIVNRSGWAYGNAMNLNLQGLTVTGGSQSYTLQPSVVAPTTKLCITYEI